LFVSFLSDPEAMSRVAIIVANAALIPDLPGRRFVR
jgi:hypothetical protein